MKVPKKILDITVESEPKSQPRPYIPKNGKPFYKDNGVKDLKAEIILRTQTYMNSNGVQKLEGIPIKLEVTFAYQYKGEDFHTARPDWDNLMKGVQDALEGVLFKGDNQVAWGAGIKIKTTKGPYLRIRAYSLEDVTDLLTEGDIFKALVLGKPVMGPFMAADYQDALDKYQTLQSQEIGHEDRRAIG
jgi:Holliday junction resolvase RusA-like endonuclease